MNTIKLKDLDKANFSTVNYIPEINVLCRRIEAMFPEDDKGVKVTEAIICISKTTLGHIARMMDVTPDKEPMGIFDRFDLWIEHQGTGIRVYCVVPKA
jgi:hypothetical protein